MLNKNVHGFTLIEVLVVVLIIAILAAIAALQYNHFFERIRIADADNLMGTMRASQERYRLRTGNYTEYWHKLDAAPVPVKELQADNDYSDAEGKIFYTRGGHNTSLKPGFAVSFAQDTYSRWYIVATRVGRGGYSYSIIRPFTETQTVCVPAEDNDADVRACMDYMGVESEAELKPDPRTIAP